MRLKRQKENEAVRVRREEERKARIEAEEVQRREIAKRLHRVSV